MKKLFALGVCLLGAGLLAGCSSGPSAPPPPPPIGVTLSPSSSAGLDTGQTPSQTLPITATVTNDSSNKGVNWTCMFTPTGGAAAACANFPSMSTGCSTCMATFTAPGSPGSVSIAATSIADSTKSSSSLTFKVSAPPSFPTSPSQVATQLQTSSPSCNASAPSGTVTLGSTAGTAYGCNFAAALSSGTGTPPFTWSATGLPNGLMISSTGMISGTPLLTKPSGSRAGSSSAVTFDPSITALDTVGVKTSITVSFNVALGFTNVAVPSSGTAGQAYMGSATVGGGTTPYHWTVSGLPTGLTSNAATATTSLTISGTPTQSGPFMVTISVTDSAPSPATVSTKITLTIAPPPALAITTTSLPTGDATLAYSAALLATGGIPPDTWSASPGALPAGLMLSADGHISGTPTMAGTFSFVVQVVDSETPSMMATKSLSITINPQLAVTTTSPLPDGTVGTAYTTTTLASTGGTAPVTWAVTTGTLPAGLMLTSASGAISGTPTAAGTSTFTVTATDALHQTATQSLTITIHPAPLSITTMTLPSGTVNSPYNQTVSATGGTQPYTFSLTASSGPLPTGLNLAPTTGAISGTPTATGTFSFTVQVVDSETPAAMATQPLSITINVANNNAKLSGDFALQFTGFADSGSTVGAGEVAVIGRFHADGSGNLTVGVLDFNTPNGSFPATTFTGTYSVGGDNRFTLTANLAPAGTFIARGVLEPTAIETRVGRIIEFDDPNGMAVRGSGEIHVQTLTDATFSRFTGDFALGLIGDITITSLPNARLGVVGRFTLGTTGIFSAGQVDVSVPGTSFPSSLPGQLSAPDATTGRGTGTVTITIPPSVAPPTGVSLTLHIAYVVVGHHQAFVVVTDQRAPNVPLLSGFVQSQRQATFSLASLTGPIVFAVVGTCGSPNTSTAMASVAIGHIVADGNGNLTSGVFDQNECGSIISNTTITGTYAVDTAVKGRVTITLSSSAMPKPEMLYLRDINKGFLLEGTAATPGNEVTFGFISPQTLPTGGSTDASLAGTYSFGTAEPSATGVPDISGVVTLTSATTPPSSVSGTADVSLPPPVTPPATTLLLPGAAVSGTYTVDIANATAGRFTASATISITMGTVTVTIPLNFAVYEVGPGVFVSVEVTSGNTASAGAFFEQ